ncbi:MAG: hypothetical protein LBM02_08010 [Lachnospiraceae bacterium]|nr:hypothetical protein [Lachnospiraceae bacterium]
MAECCQSIQNGIAAENMFLNGGVATGKTSTMKLFFQMIEKEFYNVKCIHVNCYRYDTEYKIYAKIYQILLGRENINGLQLSYMKDKILEYLVENRIVLIVGLDDYEFIHSRKLLNDIFYGFLRSDEFSKAEISIISASSDRKSPTLRDNVNTTYQPTNVYFPPYTQPQIYNILKQRCDEGFYQGVIGDDLIEKIADYTYDRGDLRYGIKLLMKIGNKAERDNSTEILEEYL